MTMLAMIMLGNSAVAQQRAEVDSELLFVRRIAPLLREKCLGCHGNGPEAIEGSLDLRSLDGLLAGGDSEQPSVVAGSPEQSPLYLAAARQSDDWSEMPPKKAEQLSSEQLQWLQDWITAGAAWPEKARSQEIEKQYAQAWSATDGITVQTSGGLDPEWTNRKYAAEALWAYQPISSTSVSGEQNPIDELLQAALPHGLAVAPRATRRILIRRATLDLTGLPPSPQEVQDFLQDPLPDRPAFARVIERLLDSPHYGERMAQHWLDVVRYADSSGLANDFPRGNAWRYRDYVVRSFNNDLPYNQFVQQQIAGDELDPHNPEMTIATGFLRMGPWELTGMEVAKVARQRFLDDVTNSVGETFLAHSLQCARCHDHKFDPLPTRDYYAIQAVFATTQLAERQADFLPQENTAGFAERIYLQQMRETHQATLAELDRALLENAQRWYSDHNISATDWDQAVEDAKSAGRNSDLFNAARSAMRKAGIAEDAYPPKLVGFTPEQFGRERVARKGLQRLRWEFERYEPYCLAVYNGRTKSVQSVYAPTRVPEDRLEKGELEQTAILTGGDPFSPAEPVTPGTLSVLQEQLDATIPQTIAGRRAAFAQWVADAKNPLTARVIVNRIWLWHFGEPLAGNPNNFGASGKRPTHPQLLDWLAATLVDEQWSIKALHRRIMTSDAYCRSSHHPNTRLLSELDPLDISGAVFRPRRLSAEELRDSMLMVTGELNPTLGGIPCRPE
ncbi:MAG: PSD1 domain-containing protein, partial [Planctomycetales bacterium]|nr:PSD1 domain-containing protein [Planctomycetales bacterium]